MKTRKPLKITFILLGVIGIILLILFIISVAFNYPNERAEHQFESTDNITSVWIESSSDDVNIYQSDNDKILVKYFISEKEEYIVSCENGLLKIDHKNIFPFFNFNFKNYTINVYIPSDKLDDLTVDISSGDMKINITNQIYKIKLETSSGSIDLNNIKTDEIDASVSSGNININNIESLNTKARTSTGDIKVKNSSLGATIVRTSSGSISLDNIIVSDVKAETSSGSISVYLTKEIIEKSQFEADCSSGRISIESDLYKTSSSDEITVGNGTVLFKLETSSGDIRIRQK